MKRRNVLPYGYKSWAELYGKIKHFEQQVGVCSVIMADYPITTIDTVDLNAQVPTVEIDLRFARSAAYDELMDLIRTNSLPSQNKQS